MRALYRLLSALLPAWFRSRVGGEMLEQADARAREARERSGRIGGLAVWIHEIFGLLCTAVASRRPDPWAARASRDWRRSVPSGSILVGLGNVVREVRYASRALLRNGAFAIAALVTLALGIGANTAIFTVVHTVLLRPLPFGEPDRLVVIWMDNRRESIDRDVTSFPMFSLWREGSRGFEHMAAIARRNLNLTSGEGEPEELRAALVTGDYFEVLDVPVWAGRALTGDDTRPGNHEVVVLSYGLWQRRFGGDREMVGERVMLNGSPHMVVGITPAGFRHPGEADLWLPLAPVGPLERQMQSRGNLWLSVIGRLTPGTPLPQAQAEMTSIAQRLEQDDPAFGGYGVRLESLHESVVGDVRPALLILLGAVAFVLLIACANVANLLLARGAARRREVSVRLAIGAGRAQLARQLLIESMVLALAGGVAGFALAWASVVMLSAANPPAIPRIEDLRIGGMVMAFAAAVSLITGVLFGLAPALQAIRSPLASALRESERGHGAQIGRVRPVLVIAEIALALMLLVGAGLMIRSAIALQSVEPGFDPQGVLTARVSLPQARYAESGQIVAFHERLIESVQSLPGVESAAGVSTLFLDRLPNMAGITMQGTPPRQPGDPVVSVAYDAATDDLFETMRFRLVTGRPFAPTDVLESQSVAVVNEAFVRQFVPDGQAVGRRFAFGDGTEENPDWVEIIGVLADAKRSGAAEPVRPEAFFPHRQFRARTLTLLVRAASDPLALVPPVREALRQIDAELPLADVGTVEQEMARSLSARSFITRVLLIFALVAAVLAAVGIYGVMAYLVSQRTREMGIRMAVGAHPGDVIGLVLRNASVQIVPGLIIGAAGALLLTRLLQNQLFGVTATDPSTFIAVTLLLGLVAILASWLPARRAAAVDPVVALRTE
ncbi:MAG: ABC transporter permease [Gemmatimonadetes bacterium]|nr:ABC transporter permease [Gemmatimonadota bacterium]